MAGLTDAERYAFDLQGYLVRERVLSGREVAELNGAVDGLALPAPAASIESQRFGNHLGRHPAFRQLLDHPAVLDVLRELCGPVFRLDHAYGIVMAPGTAGLGLHGGGTPYDPAQYYLVRNDHIYCGLVAVQWALVEHAAGDGGFLCVPGSHRAHFSLPAGGGGLAREIPLPVGSVVIFTEALTHGTLPWRARYERRTLLYKYSPGHASWASNYPADAELMGQLTERQRRLFLHPSVAHRTPI